MQSGYSLSLTKPTHLRPNTLVGHRLCPYVQKVIVTLQLFRVDFSRLDIELDSKPQWLPALSPGGTVPVWISEDGKAIFDSTAICEYLFRRYGNAQITQSTSAWANGFSWVLYSSSILTISARLIYDATTSKDTRILLGQLRHATSRLTMANFVLPYFEGENFGFVDVHFAPAFRYLNYFSYLFGVDLMPPCSKLRCWSHNVLNQPHVTQSVPDTYTAELSAFIGTKNPALSPLASRFRQISR